MRRLFFVVVLLAIWIEGYAVKVETTTNLKVYYPEYTRIDLVCEEMPKAAQKDVEFCCEAAFTGELLTEFKHGKVVVLFPESKMAPSYKFRTNWITFYK